MSNSQESTLTAPEDRNTEVKFALTTAPALNDAQTAQALKDLNDKSCLNHYPVLERRFVDPPILGQKFFLVSYVPAKGAQPNKNGIYGFAKVRGCFEHEEEADKRAELIIRTTDSYHRIHHGLVGHPFPITDRSDFSKEINDIQLKQEIKESYAESVKKKREQEQKEIEEIQEREKELLADVQKSEEDPRDRYTTLMTKKAQLIWTYIETKKKLEQMVDLIARARREVELLNDKDPTLRQDYYNRYMEARRKANLPTSPEAADQSFMRYLVEDAKLPEVDQMYEQLYGNGNN